MSPSKRDRSKHPRFATSNVALVVPADNRLQIPGPTHSDTYLASTEATLDAAPDFPESFIPEVVPEPPQENGYRSLLPEDAIPNLQSTLASCGRLMTSLR